MEGILSEQLDTSPEFETFTYGDPTSPKAGLRRLQPGDVLAFYAVWKAGSIQIDAAC